MKTKKRVSLLTAAIVYVLCTAIVAGLVVGNYFALKYQNLISVYFSQSNQKIVSAEGESSDYFTSDFASAEERTAYLQNVGTQIEAEGMVLVKNTENALPIAEGSKISVIGQDAVDPIYGGGGAGSVDTSKAVNLKTAFEKSGFELNETLWNFYEKGAGSSYKKLLQMYTEWVLSK